MPIFWGKYYKQGKAKLSLKKEMFWLLYVFYVVYFRWSSIGNSFHQKPRPLHENQPHHSSSLFHFSYCNFNNIQNTHISQTSVWLFNVFHTWLSVWIYLSTWFYLQSISKIKDTTEWMQNWSIWFFYFIALRTLLRSPQNLV